MFDTKTEKKEMSYRQEIFNIAITITHLEKMMKKNKKKPLDTFLQKEIIRLKEKKEKLIKNGKG